MLHQFQNLGWIQSNVRSQLNYFSSPQNNDGISTSAWCSTWYLKQRYVKPFCTDLFLYLHPQISKFTWSQFMKMQWVSVQIQLSKGRNKWCQLWGFYSQPQLPPCAWTNPLPPIPLYLLNQSLPSKCIPSGITPHKPDVGVLDFHKFFCKALAACNHCKPIFQKRIFASSSVLWVQCMEFLHTNFNCKGTQVYTALIHKVQNISMKTHSVRCTLV